MNEHDRQRLRELKDYHRNESLDLGKSGNKHHMSYDQKERLYFHEDAVALIEKMEKLLK